MVQFIDQYKKEYGVESICAVLPIAPSTYYRHKYLQRHPEKQCGRALKDQVLCDENMRIWNQSRQRSARRKIYRQLLSERFVVSYCTINRLMSKLKITGVSRGKRKFKSAQPEKADLPDLVNRVFEAKSPNQLWVADFTYVHTQSGWIYVAFVIDVYSRMIVGWCVSTKMTTDMVLTALEQSLVERGPTQNLIHHSDRGSQYLSIRYTSRLKEKNFSLSVGSKGDAYDNALAETINGLYKTEVIHLNYSWKGKSDVEFATLEWVYWFNYQRIFEPLGYISPVEYEKAYYKQLEESNYVV